MKIVVDANMVIAALVKESKAREVLFSKKLQFVSPEFVLQEIEKYKEELRNKIGIDAARFELLLKLIFQNISIIPQEEYHACLEKAQDLMKEDVKDAPYVATYFALHCNSIWTNDPDFKDKGVPLCSTKDLLGLICSP